MINRDLLAVVGLIGAVAILGGAFTHTLWQYTFQIQEKEILQNRLDNLEKDYEELQSQLTKITTAKRTSSSQTEETTNQRLDNNQMNSLAMGTQSVILEEKNLVIRSQKEFEEIWKKIDTDVDMPKIDFDNASVIASFYGQKPNLCYKTVIDNIKFYQKQDSSTTAVVSIEKSLVEPDTLLNCPKRTIQPYHLVQIPYKPDDVYFDENSIPIRK